MKFWNTWFFSLTNQKNWLYNTNRKRVEFIVYTSSFEFWEIKFFELLRPSRTSIQGQKHSNFVFLTSKYALKTRPWGDHLKNIVLYLLFSGYKNNYSPCTIITCSRILNSLKYMLWNLVYFFHIYYVNCLYIVLTTAPTKSSWRKIRKFLQKLFQPIVPPSSNSTRLKRKGHERTSKPYLACC